MSQSIDSYHPTLPKSNKKNKKQINIPNPLAAEICDNGIDDDGNGLIDEKDFTCYYSSVSTTGCITNKIIWGSSGPDLFWGDVETGVTKYVGNMNGLNIFDLTWTSAGKLYAVDAGNWILWEVDPYTANVTVAMELLPFYYGVNSMTGDAAGNIYIAGLSVAKGGLDYVGKINLTTGEVTDIADLSQSGIVVAGDLTFVNGNLYLTCTDNKMAVINVGSGAVEVKTMINAPPPYSMGLITLGDGFLYLSAFDKIYQLDPATMIVKKTPYFDFNKPDSINFTGLSNYAEHCNAPVCHASLSIENLSALPYCSGTGVSLQAKGTGIRGAAIYEWILPDGDTIKGNSLNATEKGIYQAKYYGVTDFCGATDSIYLDIIQTPAIDLGNDTLICSGSSFMLTPFIHPDITQYAWQDGTTQPQHSVTDAGTYAIHVSNVCGSATDTIIITTGSSPKINLGADTIICPGSTVVFKNQSVKQSMDNYLWSDNTSGETIVKQQTGMYWLQSLNKCGAQRDTVLVSYKDSCTCFPFYPKADLGKDLAICPYEPVVLKNEAHQNGFKYNWQSGNTNSTITAKTPAVYWVDVTTYCGTVRDSIIVVQKTSGCERKVMVPSAFTPNNDGLNDIFKPIVIGTPVNYEFTIYNRWGQIIYRSKIPGQGWNGMINGKQENTNIYVWTCSYKFEGEAETVSKGSVTLIR